MKKKILAALVLITLIPTATAFSTGFPDTVSSTPGDTVKITGNATLDQQDNVTITALNTPSDMAVDIVPTNPSDGDFNAYITADTNGNFTLNYTFKRSVSTNNTGLFTNTTTEQVSVQVEDPFTELFTGWINETHTLVTNGNGHNVSRIETNLYLDNNSITVNKSQPTTLNDVRITLLDTVPFLKAAKIRAETNTGASWNLKTVSNNPSPQGCRLGIDPIGNLVFQRGSRFFAHTVNANSNQGERVTNVEVTIVDNGKKKSLVIANVVSDSLTGKINPWIPEDTVGPFVASLTTTPQSNRDCKPADRVIPAQTPFGEFQKNTDSLKLALSIDDKEVLNTDITGTVSNKEGENINTGIIKVAKPGGSETDVSFQNASFTYTPNASGTYTFTATKTAYMDSNKVDVTVLADRDNDDVADGNDKCVGDKGTAENNGCNPEQTSISILRNGETVDQLSTDTQYTLSITNGNGTINESGTATLESENNTINVDFQNGKGTFTVDSPGEYTASWSGSTQYQSAETSGTFKDRSLNYGKLGLIIGAILVLLILLFAGITLYRRRTSKPSTEVGFDVDLPGEQ